MKKMLTLLLLLLGFGLSNMKAQDIEIVDNAIVFTKIVENTNMTAAEMRNQALAFLGEYYNNTDRENHLILNTDEHISANGCFVRAYEYIYNVPGVNYQIEYWCDVEHKVDVFFKENRMRIMISCSEAKHYMSGSRVRAKDFYLGTCCAARGATCYDDPALQKGTYDACVTLMRKMVKDIETYVLKHKNDNDW